MLLRILDEVTILWHILLQLTLQEEFKWKGNETRNRMHCSVRKRGYVISQMKVSSHSSRHREVYIMVVLKEYMHFHLMTGTSYLKRKIDRWHIRCILRASVFQRSKPYCLALKLLYLRLIDSQDLACAAWLVDNCWSYKLE